MFHTQHSFMLYCGKTRKQQPHRQQSRISPEIQVQSFMSVTSALVEAPHFDALVLDGKPNASDQTVEIARASDLVVIPTGQTVDDLHPGVLRAHNLHRKWMSRERIAFAMLRTTGCRRENEAARQYLAEAGYAVFEGEVPVPTAYGMASDGGRAITETSFRSLNDRAAGLAQGVIDGIAELQERRAA